jgi:hypothetical protein
MLGIRRVSDSGIFWILDFHALSCWSLECFGFQIFRLGILHLHTKNLYRPAVSQARKMELMENNSNPLGSPTFRPQCIGLEMAWYENAFILFSKHPCNEKTSYQSLREKTLRPRRTLQIHMK